MADEQVNQAIAGFSTFPVLIQTVGDEGPAGREGAGSEGRTITTAIRDILGWRVRNDDPTGFVAALNRAFSFVEVEGHREWRYSPQTLAVQADLGAVTGAQASIHARTKAAVEQALPILDRLEPLLPAVDLDRAEASRAIVRSRLEQLPVELGLDGGPRVARVDEIYRTLLDVDLATATLAQDSVGGELGRLGERFGFADDNVNTVEDEEHLTDYQILTEYVQSLAMSWSRLRNTFDRGQASRTRFLGTDLIVLSRNLAIVAETVDEVRQALRSVFIGDAEAELVDVRSSGNPPISLAEGLRWAEEVATSEGPELVKDAGKEGVAALSPTLDVLAAFADAAATQADVGGRNPRVHLAFVDLAASLRRTGQATGGFVAVSFTLTSATGPVGPNGVPNVQIDGTGLGGSPTVSLRTGAVLVAAQRVEVKSAATLVASFDPPAAVAQGASVVAVVEIDGDVQEVPVTLTAVSDPNLIK